MGSGIKSLFSYHRPFLEKNFNSIKFLWLDTSHSKINLTLGDVHNAKTLNCVWQPFGMIILVKVGNNLAPGGIVDTLYLALSNLESFCTFCIL